MYQEAAFQAPFVNSIAESMQQPARARAQALVSSANAQARATEVSGQAWGNAAQQIGQVAGNAITQATSPEAEAQRKNLAYQKATNEIVSTLTKKNTDGSHTLDRSALQQQLAGANIPLPMQQQVFKSLDDVDESVQRFNKNKVDHVADFANSMLQSELGTTPAGIVMMAGIAKANHVLSDEDLQPLFGALANGGDPKAVLMSVRGLSDKYKDASKPVILPPTPRGGAPAQLVDPSAGKVIASGGTPAPDLPTEAGLAAAAHPNDPAGALAAMKAPPPRPAFEQKSVLLDGKPAMVNFNPATGQSTLPTGEDVSARVKPTPPASMQINQSLVPSGDALSMAARKYLATGELPAMGMGQAGAAARVAVMNEAAKIDPQASLAANTATFKADSANLKNLQTTEGSLSAFESTAGKNLDQFLTLAAKIPDTGVPWLNTPLRLLNDRAVGSGNQAAFQAARDVALREIARVTNDPKLSGVLSDSARQEVSSLSPKDATFAQIKAVAQVLKRDMANVHSSLLQQIETVKSGLATQPGGTPAKSADPLGIR